MKRASGHIGPGQSAIAAHICVGCKVVVAARIEQAFLGQSSGCDKAHNIAAHNGFTTTLLRLSRAFHLLAHSNAETLADQG